MTYVALIVGGVFPQLLATTLSLQLESNTCVCLEETEISTGSWNSIGFWETSTHGEPRKASWKR